MGRGRDRKHLFVDLAAWLYVQDSGSAVSHKAGQCVVCGHVHWGERVSWPEPAAVGANFTKEDLRGPGGS